MARSDRFAERNAFVEESLESAVKLLRIEPVQARLGETASKLAHIFETDIFIPQVRSGEYRFPKDKLQTESIPAFALTDTEHIEIVGPSLTPNQIHNVSQSNLDAAKDFGPELMLQIAHAFAEGTAKSRLKNIRMRAGSNAFISSREDEIPLSEGKKALILGRPVMALLFEKGRKSVSPDIVVHEGVHIVQRIEEPLREVNGDSRTSKNPTPELEAYNTQSLFIDGLIEYGYKPSAVESRQWAYVQEMERIRSKYANPSKPYALTRTMRRKLRKNYGNALGIK